MQTICYECKKKTPVNTKRKEQLLQKYGSKEKLDAEYKCATCKKKATPII